MGKLEAPKVGSGGIEKQASRDETVKLNPTHGMNIGSKVKEEKSAFMSGHLPKEPTRKPSARDNHAKVSIPASIPA